MIPKTISDQKSVTYNFMHKNSKFKFCVDAMDTYSWTDKICKDMVTSILWTKKKERKTAVDRVCCGLRRGL